MTMSRGIAEQIANLLNMQRDESGSHNDHGCTGLEDLCSSFKY